MTFTSWLRNRRRTGPHGPGTFKPRLERLEDRHLLAFGSGGIVTTDMIEASGEWIEGLALQTDGRIVAAGNVGLARYQTDGSLDASFNAAGTQPGTRFQAGRYLNDVAVQPDGKIVAGGRTYGTGNDSFMIQRFTADGLPDSSFGTSGVVTTNFKKSATDEITDIALQPDGKIIAVGMINFTFSNGVTVNGDWGVARYNPNGSLDTTFDRDGWLTTAIVSGNGLVRPNAVALQPDGKIVVAGSVNASATSTDFAVVRYNSNGSLDQTFGQGGKVLTDFRSEHGTTYASDEARSLTLQPNGKIIVGGSSRYVHVLGVLARYNANGSLDTTFGGDGKVSQNSATYKGVSVQADGKIVAGGGIYGFVDRFHADGLADASFGLDGRASLYLGETNPYPNEVRDIIIQPLDGKILVAGSSDYYGDTRFALARLNPIGTLDDGTLDPASVDFLMSVDTTKKR